MEIDIFGYNSIRCNSGIRHTGGEVCSIKNFNYYAIIYRSHCSSNCQFSGEMHNIMEEIVCTCKQSTYFFRDFDINVTLNKNIFYDCKIINLMKTFNFDQKVKEHTRITKDSKSTVDLLHTNNKKVDIKVIITK